MQRLTLHDLIKHINNNEQFSYSRWGDGEWQCLLGSHRKWNCDGARYYPSLQKRLREIVLGEPKYYMGLQQLGMDTLGGRIRDFVKDLDITWVNSDIIHSASLNGTWNVSKPQERKEIEDKWPHMRFEQGISLQQLFEAVKYKHNVIVGNRWIKEFKEFDFDFISIPHVDCFLDYPRIIKDMREMADGTWNLVFHICGSLMTEVLIDDMQKYSHRHTFIDIGSAYDPYVLGENGKRRQIRSYHKFLKL